MVLFIELIMSLYIVSYQMKRIPLFAEYLLVLIDSGVGTFVSFGDHSVGPLVVGSEFSHILLFGTLNDVLQD